MQKDEKLLSPEIQEKAKKLWESKPENVEEGHLFRGWVESKTDQKDLVNYPCYPCNDDRNLFFYFWHYPEQALNTKLLDKDSSFKIVFGSTKDYRNDSIYKKGSVLYKFSVGGKLGANVEAYLIRPNLKNPQHPRLCKFLYFNAERYNKIPGITVKSFKPLIYSNQHPIFPFQIYDTMRATGGLGLIQRSNISAEEQQQYANIKSMLLALEQGKPVKSNDFSSAISKLALAPLTLDPAVISEEVTKETGSIIEDEKRQKQILTKIDEAFNAEQKSSKPGMAKSFIPTTIEQLVLKVYYLQCQFELDEDLAGEILATWFEQHPQDSEKIEQLVEELYKVRFDHKRCDMNMIYSKDETFGLCKKAVLDLQSGKMEAMPAQSQEVTHEIEEKVQLKSKASGSPAFLASPEMNLKQATAILEKALSPYVGKDPGKWYKLMDENKATVFEIGVSKFSKKPGVVYKNFQIQFDGASSALTILDKAQGFKVITGNEADEQIIKIAKELVAYNQSKQKPSHPQIAW